MSRNERLRPAKWGVSATVRRPTALSMVGERRPLGSRRHRRTGGLQMAVSPNVYLDYAATTPVEAEVAQTMAKFLTHEGGFGNPHSSAHRFGQAASEAVEAARQEVAGLIGAHDDEIVLTSGATEAINLAIKGTMLSQCAAGRHLVVSALEHKAVLDTAAWLTRQSVCVDRAAPNGDGLITPAEIESLIRSDTALVSVMHVNNEVGTITDIAAIARVAHDHGCLLHVDAAQSAARLPIDVQSLDVDLLSVSGHKMYGPKGVGALFVRRAIRPMLEAQTHGGGQEGGLRSGTVATHQVVGLGVAARLVRDRLQADVALAETLDQRLLGWVGEVEGAELNGSRSNRVPGILSVALQGVEAESLMLALGDIAVSAGSACTTSQVAPSHVLLGLGLSEARAQSSIRVSVGRHTTAADIDAFGRGLHEAVPALRSVAA